MAIISEAGSTVFTLKNRPAIPTGVPAITFLDFASNVQFCYSIWAKVVLNIHGEELISMRGTEGSFSSISHDTTNWLINYRSTNVAIPSSIIAPVILGRWMLFVFIKDMENTKIFLGTEGDPANPDSVVTIGQAFHEVSLLSFPFNQFQITVSNQMAVCNFKYWKTQPSILELQTQGNKWMNTTSAEVVEPLLTWSSPLRLPGDLSNIVDPKIPNLEAGDNWSRHFAYSSITFQDNLKYTPDPAYMAKHTVCAVWLYPSFKDIDPATPIRISVSVNTPPPVPTFFPGTTLWKFEDRGTLPIETPFQSITYYGFPLNQQDRGSGDIWGYFIDESGADISVIATGYRFLQTATGILVPNTVNQINVYLWYFGMQARFQPIPIVGIPQELYDMHLFITYLGNPTGVPIVPEIDLTGLFVIKRGESVDRYNRGVRLKIPNPTIRTAFIGE